MLQAENGICSRHLNDLDVTYPLHVSQLVCKTSAAARTRLASESSESDRCRRCDRGCCSAGLGAALSSSSRPPSPSRRRTGDDVSSSVAAWGDASRLLRGERARSSARLMSSQPIAG